MTACNEPEQYILALVDVEEDKTHTTYLKHAFREIPEFDITSVNYDTGKLISRSEIALEREDFSSQLQPEVKQALSGHQLRNMKSVP